MPGPIKILLAAVIMNSLEQSFIKGDDLITRAIAGQTLIVPVRGQVGDLDSIYALNEVGSRIWSLIEARLPLKRIAEIISEEYEVDYSEAASDVLELIDSLAEAGLVRDIEGDGRAR